MGPQALIIGIVESAYVSQQIFCGSSAIFLHNIRRWGQQVIVVVLFLCRSQMVAVVHFVAARSRERSQLSLMHFSRCRRLSLNRPIYVQQNIVIMILQRWITFCALMFLITICTSFCQLEDLFRQADLEQLWRPLFSGCWLKAVEQPSSWFSANGLWLQTV